MWMDKRETLSLPVSFQCKISGYSHKKQPPHGGAVYKGHHHVLRSSFLNRLERRESRVALHENMRAQRQSLWHTDGNDRK